MSFNVSRCDKRNEKHNSLVLKRPKLAHISALLKSNSGAVPLAERPYKLFLESKVVEGKTDRDGLLEYPDIPPGDYEVELEGLEQRIVIPTVPNHIVRRPQRVPDYFLFDENEEGGNGEDDALTEEEAESVLLLTEEPEDDGDDNDWEDVAVYEDEDT